MMGDMAMITSESFQPKTSPMTTFCSEQEML